MNEPEAVITWETRPTPALEFTVNFGIFAGREASRRELERLAHVLLPIVPRLAIAVEQRFEIGVDATVTLNTLRRDPGRGRPGSRAGRLPRPSLEVSHTG